LICWEILSVCTEAHSFQKSLAVTMMVLQLCVRRGLRGGLVASEMEKLGEDFPKLFNHVVMGTFYILRYLVPNNSNMYFNIEKFRFLLRFLVTKASRIPKGRMRELENIECLLWLVYHPQSSEKIRRLYLSLTTEGQKRETIAMLKQASLFVNPHLFLSCFLLSSSKKILVESMTNLALAFIDIGYFELFCAYGTFLANVILEDEGQLSFFEGAVQRAGEAYSQVIQSELQMLQSLGYEVDESTLPCTSTAHPSGGLAFSTGKDFDKKY